MKPVQQIALLGCGRIGSRVARRLLGAGHELNVWNRTSERAADLEAYGAKPYSTARDAVRNVDMVFLSQLDGDLVQHVLFTVDAAAAMAPGTLVVDLSSVQPAVSRDNARKLRRRDIRYMDATLTGGLVGADAGTLLVMVGGDEEDFEEITAILGILGRPMLIGGHGAGAMAKIAHQIIMGATAAALAEVLVLAGRLGVDAENLVDSFRDGLVHSRALSLYAQRMMSRDFEGRGAGARLQAKDLRNATREAAAAGVELPLSATLLNMYETLLDDHGDLDKSALILSLDHSRQHP